MWCAHLCRRLGKTFLNSSGLYVGRLSVSVSGGNRGPGCRLARPPAPAPAPGPAGRPPAPPRRSRCACSQALTAMPAPEGPEAWPACCACRHHADTTQLTPRNSHHEFKPRNTWIHTTPHGIHTTQHVIYTTPQVNSHHVCNT